MSIQLTYPFSLYWSKTTAQTENKLYSFFHRSIWDIRRIDWKIMVFHHEFFVYIQTLALAAGKGCTVWKAEDNLVLNFCFLPLKQWRNFLCQEIVQSTFLLKLMKIENPCWLNVYVKRIQFVFFVITDHFLKLDKFSYFYALFLVFFGSWPWWNKKFP